MKPVLAVTRWLLVLGVGAALSFWVFLATLNATIANRAVTKQWLASSGVYQKGLGSVLQISSNSSEEYHIVSSDVLQKALDQTFDAGFLQTNVNKVLDSTYDWLEGTTPVIQFNIPVQDKSAAFSAHLATLVRPKLEALPQCPPRTLIPDSNKLTCLPQGISAADYAASLTRPTNETGFLKAPITQAALQQSFPNTHWLGGSLPALRMLLIALPFLVLLFGGLCVLLHTDKLHGLTRVARRLTISSAISLVGGLFLWWAGTSIDLKSIVQTGTGQQAIIVDTLINPLARIVLPDIGRALSLFSGIAVGIAGAVWLGVFIWRHKHGARSQQNGPQVPPPPVQPHETRLPPPTRKIQ